MPLPGHRARSFWAAACLCSLPAFLLPLGNPDLFWHLSAGRWMLAHRALPRADFLSFSAAGRPWTDFEWLCQAVFQVAYAGGGMAALWLLKLGLLAASWLLLDRTLRRRGLCGAARAGALGLWSAGMLAHSDIRPELFSTLGLAWLIGRLEARRTAPGPAAWPHWASLAAVFALWANLHTGFLVGLGLIAAYAGTAALGRRWASCRENSAGLALAGLGTLANPYGLSLYRVVAEHLRMSADLARSIQEWAPMSLKNPLYWPFWPMLALAAVLAAAAWRGRREALREPPWALAASALVLGAGALRHERGSVFFVTTGAAAVFLLLGDLGWDRSPRTRRGVVAGLAAYAAFALWLAPRLAGSGFFNTRRVPLRAAEFIARERRVLEPLRLYNQWEWGGYLGWKLHPWYRVFCDGRYLFHEQLAASGEAIKSPEGWQGFMRENRLQGGVMLNLPTWLPARKRYADGALKDFPRPWYFFYMPRSQWALVYWDQICLLFVDRSTVPPAWLAGHEYRYARPRDEAALQEALRSGEVPPAALAAEEERHRSELGFDKMGIP